MQGRGEWMSREEVARGLVPRRVRAGGRDAARGGPDRQAARRPTPTCAVAAAALRAAAHPRVGRRGRSQRLRARAPLARSLARRRRRLAPSLGSNSLTLPASTQSSASCPPGPSTPGRAAPRSAPSSPAPAPRRRRSPRPARAAPRTRSPVGPGREVRVQLRAHRLDHVDLRLERGAAVLRLAHQRRVLEVLRPDAGDHVALRAPRSRRAAATSTIGSLSVSPSTVAGMKFIAGEPMKPATNRFLGSL